MERLHRYLIRTIYMAVDAVLGYAVIFAACLYRRDTIPFEIDFSSILFSPKNSFRFIFAVWLLCILIVGQLYRLYHTDRQSGRLAEMGRVIQSVAVATVVMIVLVYLLKVEDLPRLIVALGYGGMVVVFCLWRILKRGNVK